MIDGAADSGFDAQKRVSGPESVRNFVPGPERKWQMLGLGNQIDLASHQMLEVVASPGEYGEPVKGESGVIRVGMGGDEKWWMVVTEGLGPGQMPVNVDIQAELAKNKGEPLVYDFGRGETNQIRIDSVSKTISRQHGRIEISQGENGPVVNVVDTESKNGTAVRVINSRETPEEEAQRREEEDKKQQQERFGKFGDLDWRSKQ